MHVIRFICPGCGARVKAPVEHAGKVAVCPRCGMAVVVPVPDAGQGRSEPPANGTIGQTIYAGFWRRVAAVTVDALMLAIPVTAVRGILHALFEAALSGGFLGDGVADFRTVIVIMLLVETVPAWLYFALWESSRRQATIGKKLMGIVVTDMIGNRISFGRATGRYYAKLAMPGIALFVLGWRADSHSAFEYLFGVWAIVMIIGPSLLAAITRRRQALHDTFAGTLVVRASGAPAALPLLDRGRRAIERKEHPVALAAIGRIKGVPRVPRVRLVLAWLMAWSLLHVILWSCAETPFQIGSTYRLYENVSYNYDGFWPLTGRGITLSYRKEADAKDLPFASLRVYNATEFVFYVGGAWTLFVIFLLLMKKDDAGPNVPIIDGKDGAKSTLGDVEGNEDSIRK